MTVPSRDISRVFAVSALDFLFVGAKAERRPTNTNRWGSGATGHEMIGSQRPLQLGLNDSNWRTHLASCDRPPANVLDPPR
jgi:hypothetical protein